MILIIHPMKKLLPILIALLLTSCGDDAWFGKAGDPVLPGTRLPVLLANTTIAADPALADVTVAIPNAAANPSWPMAGGFADHVMQNLALSSEKLQQVWSADIGQGSSRDGYLVSQPVSVNGKIFTIDVSSTVRAFDLKNGNLIWSRNLTPDGEDSRSVASGGLAVENGIVYATTGHAALTAISIDDGKILWQQPVSSPLRSAPTLSDGKAFIIPVDNRLLALTAKDGLLAWMFEGLIESAALLGGASPAVFDTVVVAAFTSGDLIAFDVGSGRPLWNESLSRVRRGDLMGGIASVRALPVIHDGVVYAIGHSNRALAIDLRSGDRIWDLPIGGTETPWIAGSFYYVIDNSGQLIAVELSRGQIKWAIALPQTDKDKKTRFAGPVMAGGRLYAVSSDGKLFAIAPEDGKVVERYELPGGSSIAPMVVDNTLVVLTDNAKLLAFR